MPATSSVQQTLQDLDEELEAEEEDRQQIQSPEMLYLTSSEIEDKVKGDGAESITQGWLACMGVNMEPEKH
ncbi:hypothetical protein QQF64_007826 [Cirrhinus molitorella]|uniref:Uncharacterized protein n=1 Tax=Cirrhinus molitorella TaxID=172907 RepID=A0ABR3M4E4_9TELE